jgi:Tn3 transposase DDE domain
MVAGTINIRVVSDHWFELLRLALSIKTGTVTASVILRKLAAYPRQNGLALALCELGKLERTLFTLQWLQDPELRRRSHVGLNKGEQQNALRPALFNQTAIPVLASLGCQPLKCGGDRKTQTALFAGQQRESVMLVKTLRHLILGVNHHREHTELRPRRAF